MGMKMAIPVLPFMGLYTSDDARSCVNDGCFDNRHFANRKISVRKKSDNGYFEPFDAKMAAY